MLTNDIRWPHSVGMFYSAFTYFLGFLVIIGPGFMFEKSDLPRVILYLHAAPAKKFKIANTKIKGWPKINSKRMQKDLRKRFGGINDSNVVLITNSFFTKKQLSKFLEKDCKVIFPPVQIIKFNKYFNKEKKPKVVTLARISPEKKLDYALEIIKETGLEYELCGYAKRDIEIQTFNELKSKILPKNITITRDLTEKEIEELFSTAKVYFHSSNEPFGISIVEAIASGCIPIVPNESAHLETVPFDELRFNNKEEAKQKLIKAINGEFDHYKIKLKKHIEMFSENSFQEKMISEIEYKE